MPSGSPAKLVCIAAVAAPHGVRGALKLRCFTEVPESVAAYGPVCDEGGRELFSLEIVGQVPGGVLARASGIRDRDAAEALRGMRLYVPRQRLPRLEQEDEFYHEDLIGLRAIGIDGRVYGTVKAVHDFGAGDVLEVADATGASSLFPFTRDVVPEIDFTAGQLRLVPPAELVAAAATSRP
jgi:16S rRNA processing protein RimM